MIDAQKDVLVDPDLPDPEVTPKAKRRIFNTAGHHDDTGLGDMMASTILLEFQHRPRLVERTHHVFTRPDISHTNDS
jgi:hypothetical protein